MPGPYNFEPQSKLQRLLVLSAARQAAWNTALPDTSLTQVQRFDGGAVPDFTTERRSDKEYSGKGTWSATNSQITRQELKLSGIKSELSPWLAGYLFAFGVGKDLVAGAASPFTHVCSFDETTRQAIPTTAYMQDTNDVVYKLQDLSVSDFTLTISDKGAIMADYSLLGTGRYTPGAMATPPVAAPETYILGSDADFLFGPVGAPVSKIGRILNATFKFDHQLVTHVGVGGGLNAMFLRKGDPKFSFDITIAASSVDDIFTRYVNNTATAFRIVANSGAAAQLTIDVPNCNLKTTKLGADGDMMIWNVQVDEMTIYKIGNVQPFTATIINTQPTYLAVGM